MELERSVRGAAAGAVAAAVWAAQEPLDKRVFDVDYSDVELLGKAVTRGDEWPAVGLAIHIANGAAFGAAYALAKPFIPGPADRGGRDRRRWPRTSAPGRSIGVAERIHPARGDLPRSPATRARFAQATWRHVLFGVVLGVLEERLNQGRRWTRRRSRCRRTATATSSSPWAPRPSDFRPHARLAQLVERFSCKEGVVGSSPTAGSRARRPCVRRAPAHSEASALGCRRSARESLRRRRPAWSVSAARMMNTTTATSTVSRIPTI